MSDFRHQMSKSHYSAAYRMPNELYFDVDYPSQCTQVYYNMQSVGK